MNTPETQKKSPFSHGEAHIWPMVTGALQENCYLLTDGEGRGFLIDPGAEAGRILGLVAQVGAKVEAILLTHGHFDHVGAVEQVREALGVDVYLHAEATADYEQAATAAARYGLPLQQPRPAEQKLEHGQILQAGGLKLTVKELFGHARGHVVFVGEGFVIAGDTLFKGSIGRSDLPGGNHHKLLAGINRELLSLSDDTAVYSGHGLSSSIGLERAGNPFLVGQ